MKKYIALCCVLSGMLFGCNESKFLREVPEDFMSAENSYETEADFDMSVNDLYSLVREDMYGYDEWRPFDYLYGTDLIFDGEPGTQIRHSNMLGAYHPTAVSPSVHWNLIYKMIAGANTIIDRLEMSSLSEDKRTLLEAKARFFRGFGYRTLGYLYGGVPLELHEVKQAKTDYVRSTREQTLTQAMEDVKFAAEKLPDITKVRDGEVSSPAAYHLLSELYLALGRDQDAVDAATLVIENPALGLMKDRFGSRKSEADKDVYWDLFRRNNQNRGAGNTEGIWVIQFEIDTPGGGSSSTKLQEKFNYRLERNIAPMVRDVRIKKDGKTYTPFNWPVSDYTGGRGIGWGISTKYFSNTIWEDDFDGDMRNANHNFVRKFRVHRSEVINLGITELDVDHLPEGVEVIVGQGNSTTIPGRYLYAYQSKCTTPGNHPDALYSNKANLSLKGDAGVTYTDQYMFRLAETYLLRAEGYMNLDKKDLAAKDINEVRDRAHAKSVDESEIDMDYILDERMRELGIEEKRRLTLMRTQTLYDRVMKCNPYYADPKTNGDGVGMQKHYNIWPIPQSAIEANTDAILEQNPGYN